MADTRPQDASVPPAVVATPAFLAAAPHEDDSSDADSALGEDLPESTASVASTILAYRTIHGRSFHSERDDNRGHFTPNDEQQMESVDIAHHTLTLLLDGKLFLAPIGDNPQKVVDIGTGSGIWAIDFADAYPNAEIIATDLSPTQPSWVPPNLRFELDDATLPWTWDEGQFDFVHVRYLFGAVADWNHLFSQAFRANAPGGYLQSCEADIEFRSDDGTTDGVEVYKTWIKMFTEAGKKTGRSMTVVADGLQRKAMEAAGYVDIEVRDYKTPLGRWPADSRLSEIGSYAAMTLTNDLEGYTLYMWTQVMGWPLIEHQVFMVEMRKALKNKNIHAYTVTRYVYGRKPDAKGKGAAA